MYTFNQENIVNGVGIWISKIKLQHLPAVVFGVW